MAIKETWSSLADAIQQIRERAHDIAVVVAANLEGISTLTNDYQATSASSEYFSEYEARAIINGLRENNFRIEFFPGELPLIEAILKGELGEITNPLKTVYNTAQSGTAVGRKSLVPALCALSGIPFCNSDAYVVSLARHKFHVHAILKRLGLPTPSCWMFVPNNGWLNGERPPRGENLIAKAAYEAASIGLTADSVGTFGSKFEALVAEKSSILRQPIVVQSFIEGFEADVPVIQHGRPRAIDVLCVSIDGDQRLGSKFLTYDLVASDAHRYEPPAYFSKQLFRKLALCAEKVFDALGFSGLGRIDFRVSPDGEFAVIDVATSPHLTPAHAFGTAFANRGLGQSDLMAALIGLNALRFGWI